MTSDDQRGRFLIGGKWIAPSGRTTIDVVCPSTEETIASVPTASVEDIDAAVGAARNAFDDGLWPRMELAERISVLRRFRGLLEENLELVAQLVTSEMGAPISQSRAIQLGAPLALLDAYVEAAEQYPFRSLRLAPTGNALVAREPVGVVAAVVPWNVPVMAAINKMVPALLTGCTVVFKPAPETPLSSYIIAELLQEAGLPDGVVNMLVADREVSEYLVSHPGVDKVTFTGSTVAGRRIAALCGEDIRRVTLELGGKSAAIILDDADLDACVEALRLGSLRNSGQICTLKTRLIVSERRRDELLDRLTGLVRSMPVGDPFDTDTQIGPLVSERQRARVEDYIASGRHQGATLVTGGGRPSSLDRGWYVEPTVFADVMPDMRIAQEEIFGPVLAVLNYADESHAIALANDSDYGLSGAVFSADIEHALAVAGRIKTGTVEINGFSAGFQAPMGGWKRSGIGREGGREGLGSYTELKAYGLPREFAEALR
ncbi:aldehyde dehydrogenase [Mycolicibacterium confluentis]|uniref:Aldehyde dehydrogenase n=1 Tax=Mycolicibacterium confluentis TaxID=28047 RepID=A0A7I7Y218_9MYCO|nr:aldehyde dehydrogenase [Mycolicibacterium confluentis]MCV7320614.1 aldehyde dehydrogenase [Mycolicibacterium confluentis]ORV30264.1 aldehyde dehydrogenase [Mycolicibacterium confluentis]BBZ35656.1 aldehyde dehydrogenase [Mycolicibacterium confluentis]